MQINLLWSGREYHSLENCLVKISNFGVDIHSHIVGQYKDWIYYLEYQLQTNAAWETTNCRVKSQLGDRTTFLELESDAKGNWLVNGKRAEKFKECRDIDISLTPLTNTLPINRLKMETGSTLQIETIYLDILEQKLQTARQLYRMVSQFEYHFENVPKDFEADILVDKDGFVVDYPSLFKRTAAIEISYR
jgi:hypothetical protein